jgi:hypothetical protein
MPGSAHAGDCPVFLAALRRDLQEDLNAKLDPEPHLRTRIKELESGLGLALARGAFDANLRAHLRTLLNDRLEGT